MRIKCDNENYIGEIKKILRLTSITTRASDIAAEMSQ